VLVEVNLKEVKERAVPAVVIDCEPRETELVLSHASIFRVPAVREE
jgi:hypothetical protein